MASSFSRRNMFRKSAAAAAGAAFAAQSAKPQGVSAAGRKFKAVVSRGFGANTTAIEELRLLPISGRQVLVRTEVTQCCYTMSARVMGTQDPPDPNGPQAAPILNDPRQPVIQ